MRRLFLRLLLGFVRRARVRGPIALSVLAILITFGGTLAFLREARVRADPTSWHEALYYTLGLFTLQGNRFGYPHTALLRGIYFAAPLLAASAIIGALLRLVEESGALIIGRFRDHTVIGGLGNLGSAIAHNEAGQRQPFIVIERDESVPGVEGLRAAGHGVVALGDVRSAEVLRRTRAHQARQVFFTAPSDIVNLDAAFQVRRLAKQRRVRAPPTIFAHVYDTGLADALERQLHAQQAGVADIVAFNSYRFAAKSMLALLLRDQLVGSVRVAPGLCLSRTSWPAGDAQLREVAAGESHDAALQEDRRRLLRAFTLAGEADPGPAVRYAIVGLGRFGRAVVRELLNAVPASARFLLVERSAQALQAQVANFTEEEQRRFEPLIGDAIQPDVGERLHGFGPQAVIVCTDNDLGNLRLALDLKRRQVRTVTRMFDLEASSELSSGLDDHGIATVGLARLFRLAIPILTHERRLHMCVNLDMNNTPEVDHLFYLARLDADERRALGPMCVGLDELVRSAAHGEVAEPPPELALVWYRAVKQLRTHP